MNVVVTGGGTIAPIDDVRQVANSSSGNFSAAISEACLRRGAEVWHLHAPSALLPFSRSARLDLAGTDDEFQRLRLLRDDWKRLATRLHLVPLSHGRVSEYAETLRLVLSRVPTEIAFLAMAVSDFEAEPVPGKIRSGRDDLTIRLKPTPKVIQSVRDWSPSTFLVGFKLTSGASIDELIARARDACRVNRADLTIANDLRTLREGRHVVHLVRPEGAVETLGPSTDLADQVVNRVFAMAENPSLPRPW